MKTVSARILPTRILPACSLLALGLVLLVGTAPLVQAAYVTPGIGVHLSCTDLVAQSGGAVTGTYPDFVVHDTIVVSAGDTVEPENGAQLTFDDTSGVIELDVNGSLVADGVVFTSSAGQPGDWYGIHYRDTVAGSQLRLTDCEIMNCRYGVDVVDATIDLLRTTIRFTSDKAIDLTDGQGSIRSCVLEDNRRQTIYMTLSSSPTVLDCEMRRNNLDNSSPYPYINIGLQGTNSPIIRGCTIEGGQHMSGGIAIWNSSSALIDRNTITGCGYGILCYSVGANPTIRANTIADNNIHPDTVNWGFGIACNGDNQPVIERNVIHGHWYGIAITGGAQPDLGHASPLPGQSHGLNQLTDNGLSGEIYAIFNNTTNAISAEWNFFGLDVMDLAGVEDCIWHGLDDGALGLVDYDPAYIGPIAGTPSAPADRFVVHGARPNPFNPRTRLAFSLDREAEVAIDILDVRGHRVRTLSPGRLPAGPNEVLFDGAGEQGQPLASGVYLFRVMAGERSAVGRMQLVR